MNDPKLSDFTPDEIVFLSGMIDVRIDNLMSCIDSLVDFEPGQLKSDLYKQYSESLATASQWRTVLKEAWMIARKRELSTLN